MNQWSRYVEDGKLHTVFGPPGFAEALRPAFPAVLTGDQRRVLHTLWRAGYCTVQQIADANDADLLAMSMLGWVAVRFIRQYVPAGSGVPCCPTCGQPMRRATPRLDKC